MEFIKLWGKTVVGVLLFVLGVFSAGVMLVGFVLMFTQPLFGLAFGGGKRSNMPWWGGFDSRIYDTGSVLDFLVPIICCTIVYILIA